jgi:transcriptional accessory protein Tex/SPT6
LNDSVANIMKNSPRKNVLFPDLPVDSVAAVSLARFSQEPLSEYANLWRSVDSNYLFGYEVLYLSLHPLQVNNVLL